jgi:hypothetical protein
MVNEGEFENLARLGYELTSEPDEAYNCIAYAAGVNDEWWDPFGVWPDGVPQEDTVDALVEVYRRHGFEICPNGDHENRFDKIAIYAIEGSFQHAAKLLDDGTWSSKLGPDDDIAHRELAALEGAAYGHVAVYMRRQRQ